MFISSTRRIGASLAVVMASSTVLNYCSEKNDKKRVVVIGGGTGGLGVAAMLGNEKFGDVVVVEPKDVHYYQPLWSLVGGGVKPVSQSVRAMENVFPKTAKWIHKSAEIIDPDLNTVTLSDGSKLEYDYLIVAAGLENDWTKIPGMKESIEDANSGVVSIYDYYFAKQTWDTIQKFKGSRAIFTLPTTPVKCPGAPQKIMWLFEEHLRDVKQRDGVSVEFWVPGGAMFGVKRYSDMLTILQQERGIQPHFKTELVAIDGKQKIASFKNLETGVVTNESFDLLHVAPFMAPPNCVKTSKLAAPSGFVEVDQHTLQSTKYKNVFALGDCTTTPNSKTAAAITSQAPILVHNLLRVDAGQEPNAKYNGYASCPLVISKDEVILAEFGYGGKIMETFSRETGKFPYNLIGQEGRLHRKFFYWMKESMFPYVYWNFWTRGRWFGNSGPFKPDVTKEN